jgi:sterol desaturase/sphingolipid hydroxylase (fatty acid hydroxylase superfamily)
MTVATGRILIYVVTLLASLALVESWSPLRARGQAGGQAQRVQVNLTLACFLFALNRLLSVGVTAVGLTVSHRGLLERLVPSNAGRAFASVAILDFFTYAAHVSMHKVPPLWRIHRVHHSDTFVDVSTTYRFHPLEAFWRASWTLGPALVFGVPVQGLVAYQLLSALNGLVEHANLSLGLRLERVLSWLWVTPNMHKVHHSTNREETDSNFGNLFALYDRLFRTFIPTDRALRVTYGLENVDSARAGSLTGVLAMPFALEHAATTTRPVSNHRAPS